MISRRSLSINAKYAVSEVVEIPVPVSDSLQDLNVVVHSFGKGVGIAVFKRVGGIRKAWHRRPYRLQRIAA